MLIDMLKPSYAIPALPPPGNLETVPVFRALAKARLTEDFAKYERRVMAKMGKDGSKPVLNLCGTSKDILPVVMVPSGSWNV